MSASLAGRVPDAPFLGDEDERWAAVLRRDLAAEGRFLYSVRTTGVFCRPSCSARLARRENVRFHETCAEARAAGFRPCRRCRPEEAPLAERRADAVARACRLIEEKEETPSLAALADAVGLSRFHFHRVFKASTGLTPKAYAAAHRARRVRDELARNGTVTEAIYGAGFNSNGRFYAVSSSILGMTPSDFRAGGPGASIRFAVGECSLGSVLVAASGRGVCAILLGEDADALLRDLEDRFPKAELIGGDEDFERRVAAVLGREEASGLGRDLPADVRGTAFRQRVWRALCGEAPAPRAGRAGAAARGGAPGAPSGRRWVGETVPLARGAAP